MIKLKKQGTDKTKTDSLNIVNNNFLIMTEMKFMFIN